ncbi:MAG: hypothetical protein R2724_00860 [Bryobacterales bacterium]
MRRWSRSSWDIRQVLVFSYVYELPFGRERRQFGGNWHKGVDMVLGGWSLEGIHAPGQRPAVPGQRRT